MSGGPPARSIHPIDHPQGHSYGEAAPGDWLYGIDLFNHGYFWEAHEAWEGLWRQSPKDSPRGRELQGVIQLAATLIKVAQGNLNGATRLRRKALENLSEAYRLQWGNYLEPLEREKMPDLEARPRLSC